MGVERGFYMSYNVKRKSALDVIIKILLVALVVVAVIFAIKVVFSDPPAKPVDASATSNEDAAVIDAFQAGTYGGVKMDSPEDAVKYYVEAYNKTKAKTATYKNDNGEQTWSAFIGEEDLKINSVMIEGKENSTINKLVPGIVGNLFHPYAQALPPSTNRNPAEDKDENGQSLVTSQLTADDVLAVNVKDNGDGTITMQIQPKAAEMSHKGMDSQGKFFNTLGAIDSVVDSIDLLKWEQGSTAENCLVHYKGGTATVKIDTASGEIVEADYDMEVIVDVTHATVTVIKDKSAAVSISYIMHFPASDEYLKEHADNATRG